MFPNSVSNGRTNILNFRVASQLKKGTMQAQSKSAKLFGQEREERKILMWLW